MRQRFIFSGATPAWLRAQRSSASAATATLRGAAGGAGKPESSFVKRRLGVALAHHEDLETARHNARQSAACVKPRAV